MQNILLFLENLFSGTLPFSLLLITGIYLTLGGSFFQFRRFPQSVKLLIKAIRTKNNPSELSSFEAACTALSATVGTGNIAGVAGALALGGAGSVFWMWISALAGMAVKAAEITLAIIYRENNGNEYRGGPMYYIKNGLPRKFWFLGTGFAFFTLPAVIMGGNMAQTNASVTAVSNNPKIRLIIGILFCVTAIIITRKGIKGIGKVTEKLVPIMSLLYVIMAVGVIVLNKENLLPAFQMIIKGAFKPAAVTGGVVASVQTAAMLGASRGIFSNEAGLGTSAMAHGAAFDADADTQGLFGIFEVFLDTIILCTLTALTILCSGVNIEYGKAAGSELVLKALTLNFGEISHIILAVMMCTFGFSSIIGWAVYGNITTEYIFGKKAVVLFELIYPLFCVLGAILSTGIIWRLASLFNGIMLIFNTPAILLLSNKFFESDKNGTKNKKNTRNFK